MIQNIEIFKNHSTKIKKVPCQKIDEGHTNAKVADRFHVYSVIKNVLYNFHVLGHNFQTS